MHAWASPDSGLVTVTHVVYALHALSLVIGTFGAASIVGAFLFGWPSIIAVIINYVKRGEAKGTWLESHFAAQIRTFWYALLWAAIMALVSGVLLYVIFGIGTWIAGMFVRAIWAIYRITRGWLAPKDGKPLPG